MRSSNPSSFSVMTQRTMLGRFLIDRRLTDTTHSIIWQGRDEDATDVAVKELRTRRIDREPYQRFRDEVTFHRGRSRLGVLAVIDADVPESPTPGRPAWLAMPLARTVSEALGATPELERVVEAIGCYATTLARLAEEGAFHRDLKPANLFALDGEWLVGDFGLVTYPGKQHLTQTGQQLGPAHFVAPEMVQDPASAQPGPADVFSLAKTLWVLAVGQNYPPPGPLRIDQAATRLRDNNFHPRAFGLEAILEQATRLDPLSRPSMTTFAAEMRAWLAPTTTRASVPNIDTLAARVSAIAEPATRAATEYATTLRNAGQLLDRLRAAGRQLQPAMFKLGRVITDGDALVLNLGGGTGRRDAMATSAESVTLLAPAPYQVSLSLDIAYQLYESGEIHLVGALHVRGANENPDVRWIETRDVPLGTMQASNAADAIAHGAVEHFTDAAARYLELLEAAEARAQADRQPFRESIGENYIFRTEAQAGVLAIHHRRDGSRDGYAIAWRGVPFDEFRADGDRLYVRAGENDGWIERNSAQQWALAVADRDPSEGV